MEFKILVTADIDPAGINLLKTNECTVLNEEGEKLKDVASHVGDCDGILTRTEIIDTGVYKAGTNLKVVGKHGVGVDNIDVAGATAHGVKIVNAPESNTGSVVEHTLALILCVSKNMLNCHKAVVGNNFHARDALKVSELNGKVLGLLGLGRIGIQVARKAVAAFSMRVVAYDPYFEKSNLPDDVELLDSIDSLLSISDYLSLHLPLTEDTRHLLTDRHFDLMKPSAVFINAARGPIVDEQALVRALKSHKIAAAGLDVFEVEPPHAQNPLFDLDNVILSPHIAALTQEAKMRMSLHAAMGILEVLRGQTPSWPIN